MISAGSEFLEFHVYKILCCVSHTGRPRFVLVVAFCDKSGPQRESKSCICLKYHLNRIFFVLLTHMYYQSMKYCIWMFCCNADTAFNHHNILHDRDEILSVTVLHILFLCDLVFPYEQCVVCGGCDASGIVVGLCWSRVDIAFFLWVMTERSGLMIGMRGFFHIIQIQTRIVYNVRHACGGHLLLIPWCVATKGYNCRFRHSGEGFWSCFPVGLFDS